MADKEGERGTRAAGADPYEPLLSHARFLWAAEEENARRLSRRVNLLLSFVVGLLGLGLLNIVGLPGRSLQDSHAVKLLVALGMVHLLLGVFSLLRFYPSVLDEPQDDIDRGDGSCVDPRQLPWLLVIGTLFVAGVGGFLTAYAYDVTQISPPWTVSAISIVLLIALVLGSGLFFFSWLGRGVALADPSSSYELAFSDSEISEMPELPGDDRSETYWRQVAFRRTFTAGFDLMKRNTVEMRRIDRAQKLIIAGLAFLLLAVAASIIWSPEVEQTTAMTVGEVTIVDRWTLASTGERADDGYAREGSPRSGGEGIARAGATG